MRRRHQDGWVEDRGRTWYGHYYIYVKTSEGKEERRHVGVALGERSKIAKWEAKQKLRAVIATAASSLPKSADQTFEWFVRERFLPMKQRWEPSTRATNIGLLNVQILPLIGKEPLSELDKFKCQMVLNKLADNDYSFSVVDHCRTMVKTILEEALDQELISKNPARKLETPQTREPEKPVLSNSDAKRLFDALSSRDQLIALIASLCAMRPGEIFGLRWASWQGDHFQITGTAWRGVYRPGKAKTEGSKSSVAIPDAVQPLIARWKEESAPRDETALIFPNEKGTPMRPENWLRRRIKPVAASLGIKTPVCFQVFRRSFATNAQVYGNPKDVQAHLRHSDIATTLGIYTQPIASSVRKLVNDVAGDIMQSKLVN